MQAGTYWIGDLCYVMHSEWDEVCEIMFKDNPKGNEGLLTLADGRQFVVYGTAYGDGCYTDQHGNEYGVDAGVIGCILVSTIDQTNAKNELSLGHIHEFKTDFKTSSDGSTLCFGDVSIPTGDDESGESDEEEE